MLGTPAFGENGLLRLATAGSVDDGKSTLVGRLLYDTKSIFDDQLDAVAGASRRLGEDRVNLALLTDGLRAEREQKITVDVAYRYFATPRRKFIIADTPGHLQYTRNMVTGASTADIAVVLVDATTGALTQSRRHAFVASLLGLQHLIVAINKMDLVDYSEPAYFEIVRQFGAFAEKLTIPDITYIPVSALHGDNVVHASTRMPWYRGDSLLHRLETITVGPRNNIDFRFPVQCVIRPHAGFRGFAGTVASGSIRQGEEVLVLPSRISTRIEAIQTFDGTRAVAEPGDAVVLQTTDEVDVSRGDMIVRRGNVPTVARAIDSYLCWMDSKALVIGQSYLLAQMTRHVRAIVNAVEYRIDVDTLHRDTSVTTLLMNDIGRVAITTADDVLFDSYRSNSATGNFVLIDPHTNLTVAAGIIRGVRNTEFAREGKSLIEMRPRSPNVVSADANISRAVRELRNGHRAGVVWLTGLPGSGKTTLACGVERRLFSTGHATALIDGDALRQGLCGDLGFLPAERSESVRRAGEAARLFFDHGALVLCALVSPYRADRLRVRRLFPLSRFAEVWVKADVDTCRDRDPKGHYERASTGSMEHFTGVSAPYEEALEPDLVIDTTSLSVDEGIDIIIEWLRTKSFLKTDANA